MTSRRRRPARRLLLGIAWGAAACGSPEPGPPAGLSPVEEVGRFDLGMEMREIRLVRSAAEWEALWPARPSDGSVPRPEPDFRRSMLVVAAAGAGSSDGPEFSFDGYRSRGDSLFVHLCLRMPRGLTGPEDYVTYATVGAVPRHRGPVLAVVRGRGGC